MFKKLIFVVEIAFNIKYFVSMKTPIGSEIKVLSILKKHEKKLVTRLPNFPDRMIRYENFFLNISSKKI